MKKMKFAGLGRAVFNNPIQEKLPEKVLFSRLMTSLLTMLMCIAVLTASTFALFYTEISTQQATISGAHYSVAVEVAENGVYTCPLAPDDKHSFTIAAAGTATTGYCIVKIGQGEAEKVYYTGKIEQGQTLQLTVQAAQGTVITFDSGWGAIPGETCGSEIVHSTTPSETYVVEEGAGLAAIAAHYGVSENDILVYNNLPTVTAGESTVQLEAGMELKIPNPAEGTVPYAVAGEGADEGDDTGDDAEADEETGKGNDTGDDAEADEETGDDDERQNGETEQGTDAAQNGGITLFGNTEQTNEEESGDVQPASYTIVTE